MIPSTCFAGMLRRRGGGEGKFAFPDQHQIANVNQRVWEISENSNRIAPENEVNAHKNASRDAPVPKRYRNHAFALPFGGDPLHKETHREKSVPDEAEDHEITPIEAKKPVFFADPGDCDKCECVHRMPLFNVSPLLSQVARCSS